MTGVCVCEGGSQQESRARSEVTLLSLTHVMAMATLISPTARGAVCLNLEIGAREPGEAW